MQKKLLRTKCLFLDLDGTIVDSTEAYLEAAKVSFQAVGLAPPSDGVALEIPKRLEQGLSLTDYTNGETKKFLSTYMKTYYAITPRKTKLIANVEETLGLLSQKKKLALVTMRHVPRETLQKELEFFGISKYFSHVVTALDTAKPKPSPDALLSCVDSFGVDIGDCVIVGDSINDVRAGKAAGAGTVAVLSGLFGFGELAKEKPDLILNDITALPQYIV